jgi:hypothetical protein
LEVAARKSGCIAAVVAVECYLYGEEDGDVMVMCLIWRSEAERRREEGKMG